MPVAAAAPVAGRAAYRTTVLEDETEYVLNKRLSPRRLVSVVLTVAILAIPAVVAVLTAAPSCGGSCI